MITDEMVKAAEEEGAKWCSGAKHGRRGSVWSVLRDDVVISEHESDDEMSIALAEARTRAMLEAAERAAWLPIDTAPKDGTRIIVFAARSSGQDDDGGLYDPRFKGTIGRFPQAARWDRVENAWVATVSNLTRRVVISGVVTHWRPLPAPPVEA